MGQTQLPSNAGPSGWSTRGAAPGVELRWAAAHARSPTGGKKPQLPAQTQAQARRRPWDHPLCSISSILVSADGECTPHLWSHIIPAHTSCHTCTCAYVCTCADTYMHSHPLQLLGNCTLYHLARAPHHPSSKCARTHPDLTEPPGPLAKALAHTGCLSEWPLQDTCPLLLNAQGASQGSEQKTHLKHLRLPAPHLVQVCILQPLVPTNTLAWWLSVAGYGLEGHTS